LAGWFISVIPRVTLVTGIILVVSVLAFTSPNAVSQQFTTTELTTSSIATFEVTSASTTEFVGGPYVIEGCPWVQIQSSPGQTVEIDFVSPAGTVDFYIVEYANFYPYGDTCRPISGTPLLVEKGIQSFSQDWNPPKPGKYYLIWKNAACSGECAPTMATCTDCGLGIQLSYSIISSSTQLAVVTLTSIVPSILSQTSVVQSATTQSQSTPETQPLTVPTPGALTTEIGLVLGVTALVFVGFLGYCLGKRHSNSS